MLAIADSLGTGGDVADRLRPDAGAGPAAEAVRGAAAGEHVRANVNQAAAFHSTDNLPGWTGDAMDLCRCALGRLDEITGRVDRRLGLTVAVAGRVECGG